MRLFQAAFDTCLHSPLLSQPFSSRFACPRDCLAHSGGGLFPPRTFQGMPKGGGERRAGKTSRGDTPTENSFEPPHLGATSLLETGRMRIRRARFHTPSSVSFLALTELRGENSVLSAYRVCVCQIELTELSAELAEFAAELSEFSVLSSETLLSKQSSATVSYSS